MLDYSKSIQENVAIVADALAEYCRMKPCQCGTYYDTTSRDDNGLCGECNEIKNIEVRM